MVMYGHNWLSWDYTYFFYAFHMPLFFVLSGYTFSLKSAFGTFVVKKFKALLIPYLFFALVYILFYWVMSATHTGHFSIKQELQLFALQKAHTFLWFLPTLFLAEIVVKLLQLARLLTNRLTSACSCVALFILGGVIAQTLKEPLVWNLDLVPIAAAFLLSGLIYKKYFESPLELNSVWSICLVTLLALAFDSINYFYFGGVDMSGRKYGMYILFVVGALLSTYALILILKRLRFPHWMLYIGTASIIYYGLHRFVIELCFIAYSKLGIAFNATAPYWIVLAIMNVVLTCIVLYPVSRFINQRAPVLIGKF